MSPHSYLYLRSTRHLYAVDGSLTACLINPAVDSARTTVADERSPPVWAIQITPAGGNLRAVQRDGATGGSVREGVVERQHQFWRHKRVLHLPQRADDGAGAGDGKGVAYAERTASPISIDPSPVSHADSTTSCVPDRSIWAMSSAFSHPLPAACDNSPRASHVLMPAMTSIERSAWSSISTPVSRPRPSARATVPPSQRSDPTARSD